MKQLKIDERKAAIAALVDGCSINATVRMTGVSKPTILKLLRDLGCACAAYHNDHVRGLKPKSVQCDEVWSFVHCKEKNVEAAKAKAPGIGSVWTWTALDRDSKLLISFLVGLRLPADAEAFALDLAGRVSNHIQITTDGLGSHPAAIRIAFGNYVDDAQLIKTLSNERPNQAHYGPAECVGCERKTLIGFPEPGHFTTSPVGRPIRPLSRSRRRFENHEHAFALFTMHYNYCRKHSMLGTSPAVKAGLADHVWTLEELVGLLD